MRKLPEWCRWHLFPLKRFRSTYEMQHDIHGSFIRALQSRGCEGGLLTLAVLYLGHCSPESLLSPNKSWDRPSWACRVNRVPWNSVYCKTRAQQEFLHQLASVVPRIKQWRWMLTLNLQSLIQPQSQILSTEKIPRENARIKFRM